MKPALILLIGFMLFCIYGCKTIDISSSRTKTTQQAILGSVSSDREFILQNKINYGAIPNYQDPIKLMATPKIFTKASYKAFAKAKELQPFNISVNYVDSLSNKPKYIQLQIADKVALIKSLNAEHNKDVKDYLSNGRHTNVLTEISIALNKQDLEAVLNAESIFLTENGYKTYTIQLYNKGNKTQKIAFNEGVVFEYKTAHCCWQENKKHDVEIVDLVDAYSSCPNNTYRLAEKAKKEIKPIDYKL